MESTALFAFRFHVSTIRDFRTISHRISKTHNLQSPTASITPRHVRYLAMKKKKDVAHDAQGDQVTTTRALLDINHGRLPG